MKLKFSGVYIVTVLAGLFFVILLYAQTEFKNHKTNVTYINSENGVWDLTNFDFDNSLAYLIGDVKHIQGEILMPDEFATKEHLAQIGDPIDYNTGRTAKLTLLMPDEKIYMLYTLGDYAKTIYVNGDFHTSSGKVAETKEDFEPGYKKLTAQAKAENGELELIIQGGNFVHRGGSSYSCIYVGNPEILSWYISFDTALEVLSGGIFLALFLLFFILSFITKSYRINLCFSLLTLIWFLRLGVTGTKFLYDIFDNLSWIVAFKIEYITLALTVVLVCEIIYYHIHKLAPVLFVRVSSALFLALAFVLLFLNTVTMSKLVPIITASFTVTIIYICVVLLLLILSPKRRKQIDFPLSMVIISVAVLFIGAIHDALYYLNIHILLSTLTESGIMLFAFFEAIGIFYINVKMLEDTRIKEENRKIQALELERFLKLKSNFIGVVAHEIKTPLAIIMGYAGDTIDILNENGSKDEIRDNQTQIKETVKKANETVFELLDTVALETGRLSINKQKIDLKELILSVLEQYKLQMQESKLNVHLDFDDINHEILADERRIKQVVLNLLSNACQHSNNSTITIKLWIENRYQCFSIIDKGTGISSEVLTKLKSDYIDGGSHGYRGGIGIYVCNEIIRAHLGVLEIDSKENEGTVVTVKLPKNENKDI